MKKINTFKRIKSKGKCVHIESKKREKKERKERRRWHWQWNMEVGIVLMMVLCLVLSVCVCWFCIDTSRNKAKAEGVLYKTMEFKSIDDIKRNMLDIKPLLTDKLYGEYGLNNEDFTYYNFYKFKCEPSKIEVIDTLAGRREGVITYKIVDNKYVTSNRRFIMKYHLSWGKFDKIEFYEVAGKL